MSLLTLINIGQHLYPERSVVPEYPAAQATRLVYVEMSNKTPTYAIQHRRHSRYVSLRIWLPALFARNVHDANIYP